MTSVTQVSVCLELRAEYAELFLYIFCGLSHSVPVKVASRSIPGGETTGQDSCRYRNIVRWENNGRQRTQLHHFAACRRLLLRALNRRSSVNR